jgi:hypothetical protein
MRARSAASADFFAGTAAGRGRARSSVIAIFPSQDSRLAPTGRPAEGSKKAATKGFDSLRRPAYITAPQRAGGTNHAALLLVSGPGKPGAGRLFDIVVCESGRDARAVVSLRVRLVSGFSGAWCGCVPCRTVLGPISDGSS